MIGSNTVMRTGPEQVGAPTRGRHHPLAFGSWGPLVLALLIAAGWGFGCGPSRAEVESALEEAAGHARRAAELGRVGALRTSVTAASDAAQDHVAAASDTFDPSTPDAFEARCEGLLASEDYNGARDCVALAEDSGVSTITLSYVAADAMMALGEYREARGALFSVRDRDLDHADLQARLNAVFADDPLFNRPLQTIGEDIEIDRIRALGGGSTITMKFKIGEDTVAAFKPNQTRRQSNYRAEIAAYRFCYVMRCGFEVPYSFEVRVEQRAFMRMYGIRSLEVETGYAAEFVDLVWTRTDGRDYLHGVWKDWVPHFTDFPIEYEDVWEQWVAVDGDPALLDVPFEEAIGSLQGRDRGNYDELLEERGDITTRGLAAQISNLLTFDFLINNWDRFSGIYWGVNCQFADGHFVSIDNGAGFSTPDPERPRRHLRQATRFSRSVIEELRRLDPDALLPLLFPNPTSREVDRFEAFWGRRDELLAYVDGLIEEWGEDAVLYFE